MAARMQYLAARFTDTAEYVAELATDKDLVERGIVRVTLLAFPSGPAGVLTTIILKAGAIVEGRPVILERRIGELWDHAADEQVRETAHNARGELEDGLLDLGLKVRGGVLEERATRVEQPGAGELDR